MVLVVTLHAVDRISAVCFQLTDIPSTAKDRFYRKTPSGLAFIYLQSIPTLSECGMALMALMALLMLGIGFVSFRRLT